MQAQQRGGLWVGRILLGVVLGFILSSFTSYGVGMPIGTLLGVAAASLATSVVARRS